MPLLPPCAVHEFGPTLVVAPHPDDESLGCGGAIALLREAGLSVQVLFVSDGSGSHPGSRRYPAETLVRLREHEARAALAILGVPDGAETFQRLPDRHVPRAGRDGFAEAVEQCRAYLCSLPEPPATVLLPWRRDPHTDHRAAHEIVTAALDRIGSPRLIEYPIWLWTLGEAGDAPRAGEMEGWRLDIRPVIEQKRSAIGAHVSQTTPLIADDPVGWYLKPDVLDHFLIGWELFLEPAG